MPAPLSEGVVEVLTFKAGLLSRVAHDLLLRCERFEIDVTDAGAVVARFSLASLRVRGAMVKGTLAPSLLSEKDRATIESNLRREVFDLARFPEAQFTGQVESDQAEVLGTLDLNGHSRPLSMPIEVSPDRVRGQVELKPSLFGIAPYTALMGAIRLQDRVVVRFDLAR